MKTCMTYYRMAFHSPLALVSSTVASTQSSMFWLAKSSKPRSRPQSLRCWSWPCGRWAARERSASSCGAQTMRVCTIVKLPSDCSCHQLSPKELTGDLEVFLTSHLPVRCASLHMQFSVNSWLNCTCCFNGKVFRGHMIWMCVLAMHIQPELKVISIGGITLMGLLMRNVVIILLFCCGSTPHWYQKNI